MKTAQTLTKKQISYLRCRRIMDVVMSGIAIIILSPVMLLIGLAVMIDSRGPVLFKQRRAGRGDTYFEIWKFRTM